MLQFKQMRDACPKYVLTPGSNTSDIIYRRAAHIDTTPLLPYVNKIHTQGITEINMSTLTYTIRGKILPLSYLSTSEQLFLLTYLAEKAEIPVSIAKYTEQLSCRVLKMYLDLFKDTKYITLVLDTTSDLTYVIGRRLCLV
jgi:hypothetical protein